VPDSINSIAGALIFIDQPYARFPYTRQGVKTKPNVTIFLHLQSNMKRISFERAVLGFSTVYPRLSSKDNPAGTRR
jgi:hypothetical protein